MDFPEANPAIVRHIVIVIVIIFIIEHTLHVSPLCLAIITATILHQCISDREVRNTYDLYARTRVPNHATDEQVTVRSAASRLRDAAALADPGPSAASRLDEDLDYSDSSSDDDVAPLNQSLGLQKEEQPTYKKKPKVNTEALRTQVSLNRCLLTWQLKQAALPRASARSR